MFTEVNYLFASASKFVPTKDLTVRFFDKKGTFRKWHQNGTQKAIVLSTTKWCPKGTVLVPHIFLSVGFFVSEYPPSPLFL